MTLSLKLVVGTFILNGLIFFACVGGPSDIKLGSSGKIVQDGDRISVHYIGTLDNGEVFDSSANRASLSFDVGSGQVIPGFDDAVKGLFVGDTTTVRIEPVDAYGARAPSLIFNIPVENMPEGLTIGDKITGQYGNVARVVEISDEFITVDANHELAGETLTFKIEIISVE